MKIANVEMAGAWDGEEGDRWAEHADRYEAIGPAFRDALVDAVGIEARDAVLDVGCGTGRASRDAAHRAFEGRVLGVDLSRRMLERARKAAVAEGLTNVDFEQADAQVHDFDAGTFDVVVSEFGAMFFADPVAAFTNLRRALRPGGRLGMLAWRELAANEWLCAIRAALAAGRQLPEPPPGMPGPFGLADPARTREILTGAGLVDVAIEPVDAPMRLGADADDAFAFVSTTGPVRGLLDDLDAATAENAMNELRGTLAKHASAEGVTFGGAAWVITARCPETTA